MKPMSIQEKVLRSRLNSLSNLPKGQRSETIITQLREQITNLEKKRMIVSFTEEEKRLAKLHGLKPVDIRDMNAHILSLRKKETS